nr:hypothetical protein [Solirubrobacterales bacterium]
MNKTNANGVGTSPEGREAKRGPGPSGAVVRAVLGVLAAVQLTDGIYALLAPRAFFDDFPIGRGWVAALPAYNEHLVRDVGSLFLATGIVLLAAAIYLERRLVLVALVSYLAFAVPHFVYHAFNLEPYGSFDAVANMATLLFTVLAPAILLLAMLRGGEPAATGVPGVSGGPGESANGRIAGVPDSTRNPL